MLNKVIDYTIISGDEANVLATQVKHSIDQGWTPSGPIFNHKDMLNQAMVRFGS